MTSDTRTPLSANAKAAIAVTATLLFVVVVIVIAVALNSRGAAPTPTPTAEGAPVAYPSTVDASSHILDQGEEGAVTVVEFLDFECEVCGVVYPEMETLREDFRGDITFVIRYFPLPGHLNSMNAAVAAEAAAQQGRLQDMYSLLFTTQREWGEAQESKAPLFREYAEQLGLDLAAYDASVADPATTERVQFDFDAGLELGVGGTPTFFMNDEPIALSTLDDIRTAIATRVAAR